jgi:hypothetical protein
MHGPHGVESAAARQVHGALREPASRDAQWLGPSAAGARRTHAKLSNIEPFITRVERAGETSVKSTKVVVARSVVGGRHSLLQTPIEDDDAAAIVFAGSSCADGATPGSVQAAHHPETALQNSAAPAQAVRGLPGQSRIATVCCPSRPPVLPIVAVQIAPGPVAPALEDQLLRACSAGLARAVCVSARDTVAEPPRGIAVVSWASAEHVSIEVGLGRDDAPLWVSRELDFVATDPPRERWRAVGFTIALLADDPRFWPRPEPAAPPPPAPEPQDQGAPVAHDPAAASRDGAWLVELRGLGGSGVVAGALRWGGELRLSLPLSGSFFATASVDYALARDGALDVRWFDASLGGGLYAKALFADVDARLRVELRGENVAVTVRRDALTERHGTWVPGVSLGGDLLWPLAESWLLSARADAFWLDGSTAILSANQRLGTIAGAGLVLGLGAGHRF